jgi:acyl-CoA synthetase (AMP-forming)/AMP-acid ligase II/acyl carrier protein
MARSDNLRAALQTWATQEPAAPAIGHGHGRLLSRSDLAERLMAAEQHLRQLGLRPQDRVAVLMPQGLDGVIVSLQVACACSLAPLQPDLPPQKWPALLQRLAPAALVVAPGLAPELASAVRALDLPLIEPSDLLNSEKLLRSPAGRPDQPDHTAQDLVIATSGSTGQPKWVVLRQEALLRGCQAMVRSLQLTSSDRALLALPLHHTHGLVSGLLMPLISGGSVVVAERFSADEVVPMVGAEAISWISLPPAMHQALLDQQRLTPLAPGHRLRFLRSGAIAMPPHLRDGLEAAFAVPVLEAYGMSECPHICSNPLHSPRPGSVGRPVVKQLAILDPDGELLPPGEWGEVAVRGAPLMRGYLAEPESQGASQTMPWRHGWFPTGDEGRLDADGYLYLRGRIGEMINRGGLKVMPAVVDAALLSHPDVRDAAAFALPHPTLGEDLAAAVVLRAGAVLEEQELRQHAFSALAPHEVPSRILFLEVLPRSSTGKLQRISLAERLGDALLPSEEPPHGDMEELIAGVISEVLKLSLPSRDTNFFQVGGDSLSGTRVISRLAEQLGLELQPTLLFIAPTVRSLAERLDPLLDETLAQLEKTS